MALTTQVRMTCHQIHQVHIADGFADDCEELIHRWLKSDMFTYETFCEIWKDMQFDSIFHGRSTGAEIAELSEEVINIAKHYLVSNPDHFEESVAGLFIVYALLNLQPYPRFASLRIVPEDVPAITHIEMVARRTRRYDVLYILGSVLTKGPVQYQAAARERGMESSIRKYLDGTTGIDRLGVRPKGVFYRQNEELDLLRELNNITRRYTEAKKNIPGSEISLNYSDENLPTELDRSLKEIINGILEEGDEGNKKISDHFSTVQAIKEKAMKQSVDSVKFLSTSAGRIAEAKKAMEAKKLKDANKPEQTKKQPSPKKITKKRRCTIQANTYKYGARRRKKRKMLISSSSDSDISSDNLTQDDEDDTQDSQDSQGSDAEIEVVTDLNLDDLKDKTPAKSLIPIDMKEIEVAPVPISFAAEENENKTPAKSLIPVDGEDEEIKSISQSSTLKQYKRKASAKSLISFEENEIEIEPLPNSNKSKNEKSNVSAKPFIPIEGKDIVVEVISAPENEENKKVKTLNRVEDEDIDILTLPVFLRSEQDGSLVEIEIVDKMKNAKPAEVIDKTTGDKPLGQLEISVPPNEGASKSSDEMAVITKVQKDGKNIKKEKGKKVGENRRKLVEKKDSNLRRPRRQSNQSRK